MPDAGAAPVALVRRGLVVAGQLSLIEQRSDDGGGRFALVCEVEGERFQGDGST
ncbi:hypothetical protein ACTJKO_07025 [Curtobacterium sp. 22159]|uniref:hypothetical protein n=1 Tax=Curtobacterium sp. 22159 TaxID=3453882 RepID=UPI003F849B08